MNKKCAFASLANPQIATQSKTHRRRSMAQASTAECRQRSQRRTTVRCSTASGRLRSPVRSAWESPENKPINGLAEIERPDEGLVNFENVGMVLEPPGNGPPGGLVQGV